MLFGMLGALDNLLIARQLAGFEPDRAACLDLLSQLGLDGLAARRPRELSRGQQQRVALARALVNRPALILADEPTANLDDEHATQVVRLLQDRALALDATLLIATHDARVRDHFDRVLALPAQPRPSAVTELPSRAPSKAKRARSLPKLVGGWSGSMSVTGAH